MTVVDPRGLSTITEFDALGRVAKITDAAGNIRRTTYDRNGNKATETRIDRKPDGATETFTTTFVYDDQNRLSAVIDANDPARTLTMTYKYDERGNRASETDAEGNTRKFEYDVHGNKSKEIDAEGNVTTFAYDDADRLASITDANQNLTTFKHDDHGNVTEEKRADGATWTFTYDENNNRKTATDPNATVITFRYDDADRLVSKSIAKGANVLGPSSVTYTRRSRTHRRHADRRRSEDVRHVRFAGPPAHRRAADRIWPGADDREVVRYRQQYDRHYISLGPRADADDRSARQNRGHSRVRSDQSDRDLRRRRLAPGRSIAHQRHHLGVELRRERAPVRHQRPTRRQRSPRRDLSAHADRQQDRRRSS
jgi:YD repeat-containing protein